MWPAHCVKGTQGYAYHPDLVIEDSDVEILKGRMQWIDSYSGYDGQGEYTGLAKQLQQRGITKCVVVGLAFDFCVGSTALDSVSNGFDATILTNYTRSVASESQQ
jgi:nicotinamidase/pyrazinamidase